MNRTKWLRLIVRDPADVMRWAGQQDARQLDEFRYRVINGREFVSFRMVPRYAIEIGTAEIVVVAQARGRVLRRIWLRFHDTRRGIAAAIARRRRPIPLATARTAELRQFPSIRVPSPSRL
jgi:hypothetical protein